MTFLDDIPIEGAKGVHISHVKTKGTLWKYRCFTQNKE